MSPQIEVSVTGLEALREIASKVAQISILQPRPGDVVVLKLDRCLPREEIDDIRRSAQRAFGENTKIVVLDDAIKLSVVEGNKS